MSLLEYVAPFVPFKKPKRDDLPVLNTHYYRNPLPAFVADATKNIDSKPEFEAGSLIGYVS